MTVLTKKHTQKMMNGLGTPLAAPSLEIKSPYGDNIAIFDNAESFPDLELVVQGLESPLHLHRCIVLRGSMLFRALINVKKSAGNPDSNKVEWMFNTENEVERKALLCALCFCYGETMHIKAEGHECCALISALKQLRVTCVGDVVTRITDFVVNHAEKDVLFGTKTLMASQSYPECCSVDCQLHTRLAQVVFTRKRMCENYDCVVSECLIRLPPEYLDMAVYGEPQTRSGEFGVRVRYVNRNSERLSKEEIKRIVGRCDLSVLHYGELKMVWGFGAIDDLTFARVCKNLERKQEEEKRRLERGWTRVERGCKFHNALKTVMDCEFIDCLMIVHR